MGDEHSRLTGVREIKEEKKKEEERGPPHSYPEKKKRETSYYFDGEERGERGERGRTFSKPLGKKKGKKRLDPLLRSGREGEKGGNAR